MHHRRGHFLLIVIALLGLIGTTLAIGAQSFQALASRTRQAELDALVAQLVADGRLWIDHNPERIAALAPGESISLNPTIEGSQTTIAQLNIAYADDAKTIRIVASVESGRNASRLAVMLPTREGRE